MLVDRGWAPRGEADRAAATPKGEVDLVAVVAPGERPNNFSPVNTPEHILWVDLQFLRRHLGAGDDALLLGACPAASAQAWPKPRTPDHLVTAAVMPPTHAAYAATWFALSAFGGVASFWI